MKIGEVSVATLDRQLAGEGLVLRAGPFTYRVRTPAARLGAAVQKLYHDFAYFEQAPFVDFPVYIRGVLARSFRRYATFGLEGGFYFEPFPVAHSLAYLEWGLNRCLYHLAHRYLLIHSATLERDGQAVLLVGNPGSGKSTLCAALAFHGWRLLSDELAIISPQDGLLTALARPLILKNESIDIVRSLAPHAQFGPAVPSTAKGTVCHVAPPSESVVRVAERARPALVLFVNFQRDEPIECAVVPRASALMRLTRFAFNYGTLGAAGFEALVQALDTSRAYDFRYGDVREAMHAVNELSQPLLASEPRA